VEKTQSQLGTFVKAVAFAADKHRNQRRKDADSSPYINHPVALANVLAIEGGIDDVTVLGAAVLHYTIEDTKTTAKASSPTKPGVRLATTFHSSLTLLRTEH
jgi:guanosine-3',5'-bis(diphosphate) 3'-pyrophosphohydrolase